MGGGGECRTRTGVHSIMANESVVAANHCTLAAVGHELMTTRGNPREIERQLLDC